MLDRILKIEEQLIRVEALLLVISVLLMLGLATYNVFYRNVLVPIQVSLLTEDEPAAAAPKQPTKSDEPTEDSPDEPAADGEGFGGGFDDGEDDGAGFGGGFGGEEGAASADDSGGFGGGFGGDEPGSDEPGPDEVDEPADDSGGFGGGFGGDDVATDDAPVEAGDDDTEGFGGGFGSDDDETGGDDEGFGGGFGAESDGDEAADSEPEPAGAATAEAFEEPKDVPWFAKFVDAVKLEWIDVLLRQLVLVVGFLGAMIAAQRRKHITIDALSKVMPEKANLWIAVFTSALSTVICLFLAKAGSDLVKISLEYPKELVSWADEWQFQLAFPVGFGLLALHFAIRVVESIYYATGRAEAPEEFFEGGAV